jgi:hypothetical protein
MVHGVCRLDVPADRGITPGTEAGGGQAAVHAVSPVGLAGPHHVLPVSETVYHIAVQRPTAEKGETRVTVDGAVQHDNTIPLVDDRQEHHVEVSIPLVCSQTQN